MVNLAYVRDKVNHYNHTASNWPVPLEKSIINFDHIKIDIYIEVLRAVSEGCPLASLLAKEVLKLK